MFFERMNRFSTLLKFGKATYFLSIAAVRSNSKKAKLTVLHSLVICGPSGCGKSTLLKKLFADYPATFGLNVSYTSRKPRPGEKDGIDYHFTTVAEMKENISKGKFLETIIYSGNMYGTSKEDMEAVKKKGKICVLDIEIQGVQRWKKKADFNAIYIFIKPPSLKVLEERLRKRGTETEESLRLRLGRAAIEMEYGTKDNFDYIIVNDVVEKAYKEMIEFLKNTFKFKK